MTGENNHNVNWDRALEILQESIARGGDAVLRNAFVTACLPMAEQASGTRARQYGASQLGIEIDEHACKSAALQGLWEIARKEKLAENASPDKLRNLCSTAISRRFTDLERQKIGRHTRKVRPDSLDAVVVEGETRNHVRRDNVVGQQDYSTSTREAVERLLERLEKLLPGEQYAVMHAVITLRPLGYTSEEIAITLDKSPGTVASTISNVRKKLSTHYPEVEAEMVEMLTPAINGGCGHHRATTKTR